MHHTWVHRGLLAVSTAAMLAGFAPAQAAVTFEKSSATPKSGATVTTTNSLASSRFNGIFVRPPGGRIMQLTSSDCRLAGGTVVVPGDDRCGSLGAAYCRYPDTLAACNTER
jgi:hypothetical protein